MNNSQFPTARTNGLVVQDLPGEALVYDLESDKAHCLNQTASMIWKACDGNRSITDIAGLVGSQTGEKVSEDLVWLAIDQLQENSLLESKINTKFGGQSRREALKKIGMASMIALPIIASLAAPKSVLAATSCNCSGATPGGNNQCAAQASSGCGATCTAQGACV